MTTPLRISFDVACPAEHAFGVWTPASAPGGPPTTPSAAGPSDIVLPGGVGGRIYERAADGTEHEWGEVTVWQPPTRLAYLWYLGRDRADATEVEIRFPPQGGHPPGSRSSTAAGSGWAAASQWRDRNQHRLADPAAALPTDRKEIPMAAGTKEDPWALKTPPGTSQLHHVPADGRRSWSARSAPPR